MTTPENAAIEALSGFIRAMADLLHQTEEARYTDPSGGHIIDCAPPQTSTSNRQIEGEAK